MCSQEKAGCRSHTHVEPSSSKAPSTQIMCTVYHSHSSTFDAQLVYRQFSFIHFYIIINSCFAIFNFSLIRAVRCSTSRGRKEVFRFFTHSLSLKKITFIQREKLDFFSFLGRGRQSVATRIRTS